jgi:phosphoheptose isomerase
MMRKVEGKGGSARDAWKWVKKIVGEYELIKKKALKWK